MTPERALPGPGSESSVGRESFQGSADVVGRPCRALDDGRWSGVFGMLNQRLGVDQRFPDKDFKKPNERQDVDQDP